MLEVMVVVQQFPANNQNIEDDGDTKAIANLSGTIAGYQKDIAEFEFKKQEVRRRLRSWVLRWLEAIGIKRDNLRDLKHINAVDMKLLSSDDLKRKLKSYETSQTEIRVLITALQTQIESIKENAKAKIVNQSRAQHEQLTRSYVEQYQRNGPTAFFAAITVDEKNNLTTEQHALYKRADQIIATCELFNSDIDRYHLWLAWEVLDRVRAAEQRVNSKSHVYTDGAEKLLKVLCNINNKLGNIDGLELLFKSKNYEKVNAYLRQIFLQNVVADPEQHKQLLESLKQDIIIMYDQKRSIKKPLKN